MPGQKQLLFQLSIALLWQPYSSIYASAMRALSRGISRRYQPSHARRELAKMHSILHTHTGRWPHLDQLSKRRQH
ncbi:hypothetical protein B0J12DRAFT_227718 [Macrophomina phaseolina]|uniref:Secreted protein n=1 Tax=Macrophomina phaseolina TaxID=35725 RepID=A0ABQ8GPM4_9PEZI|nr:hypothetical protein B0J12DRAFT_227718 [Macrophomina phaseolina]